MAKRHGAAMLRLDLRTGARVRSLAVPRVQHRLQRAFGPILATLWAGLCFAQDLWRLRCSITWAAPLQKGVHAEVRAKHGYAVTLRHDAPLQTLSCCVPRIGQGWGQYGGADKIGRMVPDHTICRPPVMLAAASIHASFSKLSERCWAPQIQLAWKLPL